MPPVSRRFTLILSVSCHCRRRKAIGTSKGQNVRQIMRWFPIWLFAVACALRGLLTGVYYDMAEPSQTRPEEWRRYYEQVDWYLAALFTFWVQLLVWTCFAWTTNKRWLIGLALLFALSGMAFLLTALGCVTDAMIP
jgi:hypothetical protein